MRSLLDGRQEHTTESHRRQRQNARILEEFTPSIRLTCRRSTIVSRRGLVRRPTRSPSFAPSLGEAGFEGADDLFAEVGRIRADEDRAADEVRGLGLAP